MKTSLASILCFGVLTLTSLSAYADEIGYSCNGTYNSKQAADDLDPSTISVRAHLDATMLGDENAEGEYTMLNANLSLIATNNHNVDAGSIEISKPIKGKLNRAHGEKYKNFIRFDLGSNLGEAYQNNANAPETYLLVPTDDSKLAYIQRSGSGHDVYPTIMLKCE